MTQFVDGAPLDASVLAALETKIDEVRASAISIGDSSTDKLSKPVLASGTLNVGKVTSDEKKAQQFTIPFNKGTFSGKAPVVVATIASPRGGLADDNINIAIGDVTTESATIWIYFVSTNNVKEKTINVNWIALAY